MLTPNGDGVNDGLEMSFTLQGMEAGEVEVDIYDLSGRLVRRLVSDTRREGRYTEVWDGTADGSSVVPGMYLARVAVATDQGTFEQMRTVAVVH